MYFKHWGPEIDWDTPSWKKLKMLSYSIFRILVCSVRLQERSLGAHLSNLINHGSIFTRENWTTLVFPRAHLEEQWFNHPIIVR